MRKILLTFTLLAAVLAAYAQSTIKVEAPNLVSLDEQFRVAFVIEGESKPKDFQWSAGDDFQLVWGPQRGSSTSISMVNGKTTKSVQNTFTYILLPKKAGTFRLQAATATVDGNTITSRAASIEVVSGGAQQLPQTSPSQSGGQGQPSSQQAPAERPRGADIFMGFSLSKTSAVVGEPLTAVLKLYKHQRTSLAGFEGAKFPTFNGFWSQEVDAPANIEFRREKVGDNIYDAAVIRTWSIIPQQTGRLTIDPAELVCLVNEYTGRSGGGSIFDSFFEDQYTTVRKRTVSRAYTVDVSPLPSGAPAGFGGGVGEFRITTKLSKDSLKTHDAASLLVTVSGKGNVSLLDAPKVTFPPDFESYDVKMTQSTDRTGTSGSKTFEYPFIPRSPGEFIIPPIPYAYYSTSSGKYVTARTDSLHVKVMPGNAGAAATLENVQTGPAVDRKGVKDLGSDIRFIKTGNPALGRGKTYFVGSRAYAWIVAALALAAAAIWFSLRSVARRRADVRGTRDRRATKMALSRLKAAEGYLKNGLPTAFYEELHRSLLGFVGDKLAMDMADQNKENIASALQERGVEASLAGEFTALLDECEAARYAPSAGSGEAMESLYGRAVNVISSIASGMKGRKSGAKGAMTALVLALLLPAGIPVKAMTDAELKGLWNSGIEAYNAGHYDLAAESWQKIIDDGIVDADLYYNAGNAWFKDGKTARAILCYERAHKLDPSDKDIRYNLEYASSFTTDRIDAVPEFILKTWARRVGSTLSSNAWAWISLVLFALFLGLLLLFLLGGTPAERRTGFFCGIAALLLSLAAFGFARWIRHDSLSRDAAIVMTGVSSVRSAPSSETSTELFLLHEGTRVKVKEEISGYCNITLADGREGWISAKDIEII